MLWENCRLSRATLRSSLGNTCRIRIAGPVSVFSQGTEIPVRQPEEGVVEFETQVGSDYELRGR
jgi:hypothetical protein